MDARERELLTGMGNCFAACGEDFDGTVEMVAQARQRTADDVRDTLERLRLRYAGGAEYRALRSRLPAEFPL